MRRNRRIILFILISILAASIVYIVKGNTIDEKSAAAVAAGISKNVQYYEDIPGNTAGNIVNRGYTASINNYVIYQDSYYFDIRRVKNDGSDDIILSREYVYADNINVSGNFIYYCDSLKNFNIYRMSLDGAGTEKLTDFKEKCNTQYINVIDNYVYYCKGIDSKYGTLYRMKCDGSENSLILNEKVKDINVSGDWIYYISISDNNRIYRIKNDGSMKTRLSNDSADNIVVDGEYIYFIDLSESGSLFKVKNDGSMKSKITDDKAGCLNVSVNYIYYSNITDSWKLYSVKKDGSQRVKISDDDPVNININGDWIYYNCWGNYFNLYRIKTDGSKRETIR